jgi:hypothetical protein
MAVGPLHLSCCTAGDTSINRANFVPIDATGKVLPQVSAQADVLQQSSYTSSSLLQCVALLTVSFVCASHTSLQSPVLAAFFCP